MPKLNLKQGKKGKLFIPLIAITLVVWGMIIMRIVEYYSGNDENTQMVIGDEEMLNEKDIYTTAPDENDLYIKPLIRDPFTKQKIRTNKTEDFAKALDTNPKIEQQVPVKETITYKITGTIINIDSKMIVFEDVTNNKTEFLREGQTYKYIKIIKIDIKQVELTEYDEKKIINIE